jgi:hypothetical protein
LPPPWPNVGVVSPDQSVSADESGMELFDLATGKLLVRLDLPKMPPRWARRGFFSPSGKHYMFWGQAAYERLFAVPSGKFLCELPVAGYNVTSSRPAAFTDDERLVAIFGHDRNIHVCDTATGHERQCIAGFVPVAGNARASLALSPDGKHVACWLVLPETFYVDPGRTRVYLWDVATRSELLRIVPDSSTTPGGLAWSPDGRVLAMGQHKIQLWETATLKLRHELPGHGDGMVQALALGFSRDSRLLASGSSDSTILIWDPSLSGSGAAPAALTRDELARRWQALSVDDAGNAYAAMNELVAVPRETVAWVKEHLKPTERLDGKRVEELIGQLGHDEFSVRQKAATALLHFGEPLVPTLDRALAGGPPLEMSLRLQDLRKRLTSPVLSGPRLQAFRAVEVLERIGTPPAREVLELLAGGAPAALLTTQAQAVLERWR